MKNAQLSAYEKTISAEDSFGFEVLENDAHSQAKAYVWTAALPRGQQSTEDEYRSGRQSDACNEEMLILSRT